MAFAQRIEKRRLLRAGGLESLVDSAACMLLCVGILISCSALLSMSLLGVVVFFLGLFGSFIQWLLFRCIAELIRLQKKLAGLEYSGAISAAVEETIYTCSNCHVLLHSETRCDSCGSEISLNAR
jgi:hypothetical protein